MLAIFDSETKERSTSYKFGDFEETLKSILTYLDSPLLKILAKKLENLLEIRDLGSR